MEVLVDHFASCSGLEMLSYGSIENQRCHADLVSMLENLRVDLKLGLSLLLQSGRGFRDIQPPVDLSFCHQTWAAPAPDDLSALICCQSDACIHTHVHVDTHIRQPGRKPMRTLQPLRPRRRKLMRQLPLRRQRQKRQLTKLPRRQQRQLSSRLYV